MSNLKRDQKAFATKQDAEDFAAAYRKDMWAYDGSTNVYQQGDQWIVAMTYRDSCD